MQAETYSRLGTDAPATNETLRNLPNATRYIGINLKLFFILGILILGIPFLQLDSVRLKALVSGSDPGVIQFKHSLIL